MARGGKRQGAGRRLGSKNADRPKIRDFIKPEEITDLVETCKKQALDGRPELMKFLLEQIFGKAVQPIGNDEDKPFQIAGVEITIRK
jgi:hypothetical protein